MNMEELKEMVYKWKTNEILLQRNELIAKIYEDNKNNFTDIGFLKLAIANFLLEGLYFYNGFQFFHNLASRNLMIGTDIQIRYIQRDENLHCAGFREIIKIYKKEGYKWDEDLIYDMFKQAVEWELKFSKSVIGDKILGMSEKSIEDYTYYLANRRLKEITLEPIFPKTDNPYKHLDKIAAIDDETTNRGNNFEIKNITYKEPNILKDWDQI
jgi:ribonucleoside-diphosphate reductase beta chain